MKHVALKPFYGKLFKDNKVFSIDNGNNIFFQFDKSIKKHRVEIVTLDTVKTQHVDKYVYCDIPYPWEGNAWLKIIPNKKRNILFCFDSPIVTPLSHITLLHMLFAKIYTWSDTLIDNKKYFKLHVPQLSSGINRKPLPFEKKKLVTLINSNKSSSYILRALSGYQRDIYKERLMAVSFFEKNSPDLFDLYGKGWDKSKRYKTYKGQIPDGEKLEVLSKYKFNICFENTSSPGYITEKIFDSLKARCVPIYWGAPNITDYIRKDCFIDFREFMDYDKLLKYLLKITEKEYNKYLSSIEKFLADPHTKSTWFEEGFEKTFLNAINE